MSATQSAGTTLDGQSTPTTEQFLTFLLGSEEYGIPILQVQEIRGWQSVTPIPNTPDFIKGVMNLRGTIVPVVDLRQRFRMPSVEYKPTTVVIVLRIAGQDSERTVGIVVDAVSEVYDIAVAQLQPPPDFGNVISTEFMQGLATLEQKMVILLDINGLISNAVLNVVDEVADQQDGG